MRYMIIVKATAQSEAETTPAPDEALLAAMAAYHEELARAGVLLDASGLLSNPQAFVQLRRADLIALVVEAQKSTVPTVEHALGVLSTAFGKVDGVIINRRRFEVPTRVLQLIATARGAV